MINGWRLSRLFARVSSNFESSKKVCFQFVVSIRVEGRRGNIHFQNNEFRIYVYVFVAEFFVFSFSFPLDLNFFHLSPIFIIPYSRLDSKRKSIRARIKSIKFWKSCARNKVCNWIITSNGVMDHATPRVKGRKLFKPWNVTRNFILNRTNLARTIFPNNASVESCNWFKWHAQEESV